MLLCIDIGNTNITLGVFNLSSNPPIKGPIKTWRLATDGKETADEYGTKIIDLCNLAELDKAGIKDIAIASVVPALDITFKEMSKKYFNIEPFFVMSENPPIIKNLYKNPKEVGADRIAGAVAAFVLKGGPVVVLDFGTATTIDCITAKGEYLGGVIAPGLLLAAQSLAEHTSKLPNVEIRKPDNAIGRTTVQSIQSGVYIGYIGLIKEILRNVIRELGGNPYVIATGGFAGLLVSELKMVKETMPDLTLEGIRIIWEKSSVKAHVDSVDKTVDM